jgi:hypothetical protein
MSLACSNLFKDMSKGGQLRDVYREKDDMKIGTEERGRVCKHMEWLLSSLPKTQG